MKLRWRDIQSLHVLTTDLHTGWIGVLIQLGLDGETRGGRGMTNYIDDHLVTNQRPPPPILGNMTKHPMFDLIPLTVRPFLRRFRRNSTKPCIESQREAQYLQKTLLEWAQSGDGSIGLLAPFDDDGQGDTLKRFEQAFGRRASRFAPGIPGLKSCPLCSLIRSLTAADTCQERQPPQGHRYQPEEPCGLVVSLHRHRCAGEGPPCERPQAPLHLIGTARGQHRVRQGRRL